ncbi:hypothetical protein FRIGORI9N_280011 [Frigoribacterium sp. 9N]|nr:hypothetical protein FRIGORI9N_280011 [Frigoribacterium sp. 9N]
MPLARTPTPASIPLALRRPDKCGMISKAPTAPMSAVMVTAKGFKRARPRPRTKSSSAASRIAPRLMRELAR